MNERGRRLSFALLTAAFALLALALAWGGRAYYRREAAHLRAHRWGELRTIASLKTAQITAWRQDRLADARLGASHNGLEAPALAWLERPGRAALKASLLEHMALFQSIRGYQNVLLADPSGRILLTLDPRTRDGEPEVAALAARVVRAGHPILGELFRCAACGGVHLDAAAPILDARGRPRAVLLLRTDPEVHLYPLLQAWPAFGQTGETLLVRREGREVLFLNRLRHDPRDPLTFRTPADNLELPAAQALAGRTGSFEGLDYRGEPVLAELQAIPDSPWRMVAKVDTVEILAELRYRARMILAVTALGILMLGSLLGFLFFLGQAKLYQDLFRATRLEESRAFSQDPRWVARCHRAAGAAGLASLAIGAIALAGWILDQPALKGVLPGFVAMKTNTAIGLMLAGLALALRARPRIPRALPAALGVVLATLGGLTLVQYLAGVDLRIDQWLFREAPGAIGTLAPNRMAPATAVAFLLGGWGLALAGRARAAVASQWLAVPVGLIGLLPLLGYLYGPFGSTGLGHYLQLALHTALACIAIALGLLLLTPSEGPMRVFTAHSTGGWLLRRMVPIILALSTLIGWLWVAGERWGWFEHSVAVALMVTAYFVLFLASTWWAARSLDRMDGIRSEAEARAREAAEEIRATLYGIGDGVIAADRAGAVVHMNPVAEQLTGWKESEAIGRPLCEVFRIVNEETRETVESPVDRVLRDGRIVGLANHTILIARDGTERAIADSGAPIWNADRNIARVVLVFRDQTEERRLARLLKVRLDLRAFADHHTLDEILARALDEAGRLAESPLGFYHFYDEETGGVILQQWSAGTLTEFGKAEGQGAHHPLGQTGFWADCIHRRTPLIRNNGTGPVARELVVPVLQGDRVAALLGVGNKPTDYTDRDVDSLRFLADETWSIIEHKRYEMALQASEAKHRQLHENLRDAYARVDREGYIVDHNRAFEELVGYTGEELRGMTYRDLTPPEWHAEEDRILREQVEVHGYSEVYEKAYRRKDGTIFPVELQTIVYQDAQGRPDGMWALVRDITARRQSEERVREAERTARGTLDGLAEHIAILDERGLILGVNQAWRRFAEENPPVRSPVCEGANYFEVCAAATGADAPSAAAFAEGIRSVMEGRETDHTQEYACHSPDTLRWFLGRVTRFAGGGPLRVVVAHENITERKLAEEALRASEAKFRLLVESNPDAIAVETHGRLAFLNPAAAALVGASSPADLVGRAVLDLVPSDRRVEVQAHMDRSNLERKAHPRHEETFLRLDGTPFPAEVTAVPIQFQGEDGALVFLRDITDRLVAEAQIRAQTQLLNLTGEMAKVGGWEFDARTWTGSWTQEVARIFDLDPSEGFDASRTLAYYSEASRPLIAQALGEAIDGGRSFDLELELISAQGVRRTVRTIGHPVRDAEERVARVRGILMDITEKKAAEDEIRRAQAETQRLLEIADRSRGALLSLVEDLRLSQEEIRSLNAELEKRVAARTRELAEANQELEAFAYSVSHDLRAPLRHMDGFLSMLERHLDGALDDKGARYLQVAQRAAMRMAQLVDGLLSFSRLGRTELRRMPVETAHIVASVVDEFASECSDRVVRWDIGPLPVVHGDPTLLRLVFQNLLGNALKFTRHRPEARIEIRILETRGDEATLSIRDNGAGFDPAYTHKLFGVFQRLHREDEFEGTGIGLANVHRIIARHGGRVWAEGRLDEGATFFITLPTGGNE